MSKITLSNIGNLADTTTAQTTINNNSAAITTAIDNTISRDGTLPNVMNASFDMNLFQILNLPAPATGLSPLRLQDLSTFVGGGTVTNIPTGGTTGQVLGKSSGVDFAVTWLSSVTSVGLSMPADFTVLSSPVTGSGTITVLFVNTPTGTGSFVRAASPTLTGTVTINGSIVDTGGNITSPTVKLAGATSGTTTLQAVAVASGTVTIPSVTDTMVGKATTDIFTNKTFDTAGTGNSFSINSLAATANTGTGAVVRATSPTLVTPVLGAATGTSLNLSGLTVSSAVATDGSKNLVSVTNTGSGSNVLATSPTLVTPVLGVASATSLTLANGVSNGLVLTAASGTNGSIVMAASGNIFYNLGSATNTFFINDSNSNSILSVTGGSITTAFVTSNSTLDATTSIAAGLVSSGGLAVAKSIISGASIFSSNATFLSRSKTTLTNNAAAATATLTNSPTAGNPTKWIGIDDNGTTRFVPAW